MLPPCEQQSRTSMQILGGTSGVTRRTRLGLIFDQNLTESSSTAVSMQGDVGEK
jgi:hypothetical protein